MANDQKRDTEKSHLTTLGVVKLTAEQTERIKQDIGVEVTYLVAQQVGGSLARDIDPNLVSLLRFTWCW